MMLQIRNAYRPVTVAALLAAVAGAGCAPKNGLPRTPREVEVAIRRAADAETGSVEMIVDKMAESLAAWRARCVAEAVGRSGRVRVTSNVEQGEYAPLLTELVLPYAAEFKDAEREILSAAGLTPAESSDESAVIIDIVLQTTCSTGCEVDVRIQADRLPEWHRRWNLVLTGDFPVGRKK